MTVIMEENKETHPQTPTIRVKSDLMKKKIKVSSNKRRKMKRRAKEREMKSKLSKSDIVESEQMQNMNKSIKEDKTSKTLSNTLKVEIKRKKEAEKQLLSSTTKEESRILPYWLANPIMVGNDLQKDGCDISDLPYLHDVTKKFGDFKMKRLFPVQKMVLPQIIGQTPRAFTWNRRNDICISAPTGSGKTFAYLLPILHCISNFDATAKLRAIIVLPTQQLAQQILKVVVNHAQTFNVRVGSAIGSRSTAQERKELIESYEESEKQVDGSTIVVTKYRPLAQIVIATPGRLESHMELTPGFDLSELMFLVLDEADILLSSDGGEWTRKIEKKIRVIQRDNDELMSSFDCEQWPTKPPLYAQRILVSATLSSDPELLDAIDLYNPILYSTKQQNVVSSKQNDSSKKDSLVDSFVRPTGLIEEVLTVNSEVKPLALYHLLKTKSWKRTVVFVGTNHEAHDLAFILETLGSLKVAQFSAKLKKKQKRLYSQFKRGDFDVMVSTDVLDRGMDFYVSTVVNYNLPSTSEVYVHRVGRTARAGKEGLALTLVTEDTRLPSDLKKLVSGKKTSVLDSSELHQYEESYKTALNKLKNERAKMKVRKNINWEKHGVGLKRKQTDDSSETTQSMNKKMKTNSN